MDRQQLLNEYEASSGNNAVGRVEQYPGRTPQNAGEGTSSRPTGMQEFGPSAGPSAMHGKGLATQKGADAVDTKKYPTKGGRRDEPNLDGSPRFRKGRDFDGDTADSAKNFDDTRKTHERAIVGTAAGMTALAIWMASQGMTGDDETNTMTASEMAQQKRDQASSENSNPNQGSGSGRSGGGGMGGGGMTALERVRAAQGDRYIAGLSGSQTVRGFR